MTALRHGSETHIGKTRQVQQDAMAIEPPLYAVADGMGGHRAGDVAAQLAIEVVTSAVKNSMALKQAVLEANRQIIEKSRSDPSFAGMGTTITALVSDGDSALIANVGDSRAYLLRDGTLSRLTEDHSVVERMVRQGKLTPEEAAYHPRRSQLERALGVEDEVDVDVEELRLEPGDRILLCTDGLTVHLEDDEIAQILSSTHDPDSASRRLVESAVDVGGVDNVTVVVLDVPGERAIGSSSPAPTTLRRKTAGRRWWAVALALLTAVFILLFGGRLVISSNWFVGEQDGRVAIYRGIPESFAGVEMGRVETRTAIDVKRLPEIYREQLREGIKVESLEEAQTVVKNLDLIVGPASSPTGSQ